MSGGRLAPYKTLMNIVQPWTVLVSMVEELPRVCKFLISQRFISFRAVQHLSFPKFARELTVSHPGKYELRISLGGLGPGEGGCPGAEGQVPEAQHGDAPDNDRQLCVQHPDALSHLVLR